MGFRYFPDTRSDSRTSDYLSALFGDLDANQPIELMKYEKREKKLVFSASEVPATSRLEPRSEEWTDREGIRRTSRWWQESVRCEPGSGVKAGDQLVISFFPWSVLLCDVATFHEIPHPSKTGETPKSLTDNERSTYRDEQEFLRSLDRRNDSLTGSPGQLVASVRRPQLFQSLFQSTNRQPRGNDSPRLVYGLVQTPDTVESFSKLLLESNELVETRRLADIGVLKIAHPKANSNVFLNQQTKEIAETLIVLHTRMLLAGPAARPEVWYGKSVAVFVSQTFRGQINNANRRIVGATQSDRKWRADKKAAANQTQDQETDPSEQAIIDDDALLKNTLRSNESELAILENRLRQITDQISACQSIIGQSQNQPKSR